MRKIDFLAVLILSAAITAGCDKEPAETVQMTIVASTSQTEVETDNTESTTFETTAETTVEATVEDEREINIEITSPNLTEGVWDTKITNTLNGENVSPELSWTAIDGASCYVVYMIDTKAYWLHMEVLTSDTDIALGQIDSSDDNKYVGPYPPYGTHPYNIYVVALKEAPGDVNTHFDAGSNKIDDFLEELDISQSGESGNIIGYGVLEGEYTAEN